MLNEPLSQTLRTTKKHIYKLEQLGIRTVKDLIKYFPRTYNDKREFTKIIDIKTDEISTVKGFLRNLYTLRTKYGKKITRGVLTDDTASIEVVWFNQPHLVRMLGGDTEIILSGKAKFAFNKITLQSPSYEQLKQNEEQIHSGGIIPVYHESEEINSKWLREKLKPLIKTATDEIKDYLPEKIRKEQYLIELKDAIKNIHFPESPKKLEQAKKRLSFDELFLLQIKILQKKWRWKKIQTHEKKDIKIEKKHTEKIIKNLPYTLTNAQKRVLTEIYTDLQSNLPMSRLIQGDVGSGKTIIAILSAIQVVKNGHQVAVMAPTEILAQQHYKNFIKILKEEGINIQFLAGSTPKKKKEEILMQMKTHTVDIIIGTHSLIQENIGFYKLGLSIIDEQHRFGVKQRNTLKKFDSPHMLAMTATPIPRTLAITIYGDQDISIIDEMPKGRQKITTGMVPEKKRLTAYRWVEDQIKKGRQAFIICPLIDESDTLGVKSVKQEYAFLKEHIFKEINIGLLHGKLKQEEKDEIMEEFKENKIKILVSTSVIEVGIDIPNATIMIIEGAERFGLAQLHQFRGRVGRGEHKSYCFLFTGKLSEEGLKRMKSMEKYDDGFKLAEIDLEIRGPGEIYGVKQSGIPDLKIASLTDFESIKLARNVAEKIINKDPELIEHQTIKREIEKMNEIYIDQ